MQWHVSSLHVVEFFSELRFPDRVSVLHLYSITTRCKWKRYFSYTVSNQWKTSHTATVSGMKHSKIFGKIWKCLSIGENTSGYCENGLDSLMNRNSQNMSSKSHWSTAFPHSNCSVKVQLNTTTCLLYELSSQPRRADKQFPNRCPML